jgi:hypothetical protein
MAAFGFQSEASHHVTTGSEADLFCFEIDI